VHYLTSALTVILSTIIPTKFRKGAIFVPILGNLRGSIGANTFSHNRGGDYIRRRVAPTNPNSTRQQTMRSMVANIAGMWSNVLSSAQRAAWNIWAGNQSKEGPLGNTINLTGINGFVWCNAHVLDAGDALLTDPPIDVAPNALSSFSVDVSAALVGDVTFLGSPMQADDRVVMFMSLPQAGSAEPNFKQCRIVGYSDKAQASPWAAALPFAVASGNGVVFFAAVYDSLTGLFSGYLRATDLADY